MDLTTPLIAFLFVCLIFPKIVRNRPQFYISFGLLVLILLLNIVASMFHKNEGFVYFLQVIAEILRLMTFILLVLCAGGLSLHELTGEVFRSFEVMRRGDTEKTVIIPLTGQKPRQKEEAESSPPRENISETPPAKPDNSASIPLDESRD